MFSCKSYTYRHGPLTELETNIFYKAYRSGSCRLVHCDHIEWSLSRNCLPEFVQSYHPWCMQLLQESNSEGQRGKMSTKGILSTYIYIYQFTPFNSKLHKSVVCNYNYIYIYIQRMLFTVGRLEDQFEGKNSYSACSWWRLNVARPHMVSFDAV